MSIVYEVTVYEYKTEWKLKGKLHREDGPAIEWADGDKWYYVNGERHREDGPAIEWADGDKAYWINGEKLTEKEFNSRNSPKELTVKDIEILLGYSVKVVSSKG